MTEADARSFYGKTFLLKDCPDAQANKLLDVSQRGFLLTDHFDQLSADGSYGRMTRFGGGNKRFADLNSRKVLQDRWSIRHCTSGPPCATKCAALHEDPP